MLQEDKDTYLKYYEEMFQAIQKDDLIQANNFQKKMEHLRLKYITNHSKTVGKEIENRLSSFAKSK